MFSNLTVFKTSHAMARHAGVQQALVSENMANSDTPGFARRQLPDFALMMEASQTRGTVMKASRAGHLAGADAMLTYASAQRDAVLSPNGNNVSIEEEMLAAVGAKRQHDRALAIYRASMGLIRSSLGRT